MGFPFVLTGLIQSLYVVQSALLLGACVHGLGDSMASAPKQQLEILQKVACQRAQTCAALLSSADADFFQLYYASNALYVLSFGSSQATVACSMARLVSSGYMPMVRVSKAVFSFALLWTFALVLFFSLYDHPASAWKLIDQSHAIRVSGSWL